MLRPERMSRISVTGSTRVMDEVIETVHRLGLVHVVDYDGSWAGFEPGDPLPGADESSERLVTVRSIESILDVSPGDAGPTRIVTDEALHDELEEIRAEVNALDDRRDELRDELRRVEERIDSMAPFAAVGIDLDLLSGYDSIEVVVGQGDAAAVEAALADADGVAAFEVFAEGDALVAAVAPPDAAAAALVGIDFESLPIPDAEGSPGSYLDELRHRRQQLRSRLGTVEGELEDLKLDAASFLLAAEETLSIDVQRKEAPLSFATTESAFITEGWIPTDRVVDLEAALRDAVGDHVEVDELEVASYTDEGVPHHGDEEAVADGGTAMGDSAPPVIQDNPTPIRPFELLVETISRPRYSELDPTVILFLTFPTFFGFMIGDLGYGILYTLIGYLIYSRFEGDALRSLGGIAIWAGGFTMLFGVLYGEVFGLHVLGDIVWGGHPPIEKGLSGESAHYAMLWLVVAVLIGLVHVSTGYLLDFVETLNHGVVDAVLESLSWVLLMGGVWVWILSRHAAAAKPALLFEQLSGPPLGFTGFSPGVGLAALAVAAVGLALMVLGEVRHEGGLGAIIGILESPNVLVNVLSYARIPAVLLAKAGMAFVVNLLVFGAYVTEEGATHFMHSTGPAEAHGEILFAGLVHGGVAAVIGGLVILVLGHLVVLALGVTSAGLQAIRLEYVEFFGKFYEGGGENYEPFGYQRTYTTED